MILTNIKLGMGLGLEKAGQEGRRGIQNSSHKASVGGLRFPAVPWLPGAAGPDPSSLLPSG